jgi:membrane dipeptidase
MHFFANYVRDRNATIDDLIDHILHVAQVAGIDHVGLGPDWLPLTPEFVRVNGRFAGLPSDYVRPPDQPLGPVAELDEIRKLPRLTERMVERGMADEDISKVLGGNLLRVYRDVWSG